MITSLCCFLRSCQLCNDIDSVALSLIGTRHLASPLKSGCRSRDRQHCCLQTRRPAWGHTSHTTRFYWVYSQTVSCETPRWKKQQQRKTSDNTYMHAMKPLIRKPGSNSADLFYVNRMIKSRVIRLGLEGNTSCPDNVGEGIIPFKKTVSDVIKCLPPSWWARSSVSILW